MAQQSQKTSNREEFKRVILRGVLYTIVIPVLVIAVIVGGIYLKSAIEASNAQASMKEYLQKKYGQEFVIENYRIEGSGLAVEGDPKADAYLVSDPSVRFEIRDRGKYKAGEHAYWDDYPATIWQRQEVKGLEKAIKLAFGHIPDYDLNIHLKDASSAARAINQVNFPVFEEARLRYGQDLTYGVRVTNTVTHKDHYKAIEALAKFVKERAAGAYTTLSYKWISPEGQRIIYLEKDEMNSILNGTRQLKEFDRIIK